MQRMLCRDVVASINDNGSASHETIAFSNGAAILPPLDANCSEHDIAGDHAGDVHHDAEVGGPVAVDVALKVGGHHVVQLTGHAGERRAADSSPETGRTAILASLTEAAPRNRV